MRQKNGSGADWILENFPHLEKQVAAAKEFRGGIIGSVTMTDCVSKHDSPWYAGDWAFVMTNPKPLDFMPYKGQLQFFEVPLPKTDGQMLIEFCDR